MDLSPGSLPPHTILLTQTSLHLSWITQEVHPRQCRTKTGHHGEGHVTPWYGNEHPSKPRSNVTPLFKWLTPIRPSGATLYQERALASRILECHCGDCKQGACTSDTLQSHTNADITNQPLSTTPSPSAPPPPHRPCFCSLDTQTSSSPCNLHICCNWIPLWLGLFCHSGLGLKISPTERTFLTNRPPSNQI